MLFHFKSVSFSLCRLFLWHGAWHATLLSFDEALLPSLWVDCNRKLYTLYNFEILQSTESRCSSKGKRTTHDPPGICGWALHKPLPGGGAQRAHLAILIKCEVLFTHHVPPLKTQSYKNVHRCVQWWWITHQFAIKATWVYCCLRGFESSPHLHFHERSV